MSARDQLVVGAGIGALAAAERLAARGERVLLLITGRPGGSFAEFRLDGRPVGLGLRLIEREYVAGENTHTRPPVHEHVPGHAGHRPWMGLIADYLDELVPDLTAAETPQLQLRGRTTEDFTLTGRVAAMLALLSPGDCHIVACEAAEAAGRCVDPAGVLADPGLLADSSLERASIANHGRRFHDLVVAPIASALLPGGAGAVAAEQRHKVWAPVYWPETLAQAASGASVAFRPDRRFWVDADGGMAEVAAALWRRLASSSRVTTAEVGPVASIARTREGVRLRFRNGLEWTHDDPIIGLGAGELFEAAGVPFSQDRVSMSIAWADVADRDLRRVGATTILDPDQPAFRLSTAAPRTHGSGAVRRAVAVELRHGTDPAGVDVADIIARAGLIDDPVQARPLGARSFAAFAEPTTVNRDRWLDADARLADAVGGLRRVGASAGYGADPLNEQLFSGIRAALEVSHAHV